jgi:uncharacterized protein (TIGR02246 family)
VPAHRPEDIPRMIAAAFNDGGPADLVALYEPDAVLVAPGTGERIVGRAAITARAHAMFDHITGARIDVVGKVQSDGLAMTHADWALTETAADGGVSETTGRGTVVSRRQPDGTWLVVFDNPLSA